MKLNNAASLPVKLLRYLLMAFVLLISLYPIAWVLINSFKQTPGGLGFPEKWVFDGYITIFTKLNIGRYFANSLIVTVISTVFSVFVVSLAAYVSARIEFRGKNLVTLMFASTLFIPSISISFPIYRLLSDLGLKDNLDATLMLCKVMAKHNVKRIIFSSSATVYSGDNEMPLRETSKTGNCTNPYGWTKYMGEQILRDIAKADPEWSVVNLRYFNPVGAHESGKIGEHPNGIPNNLMPYISQTAIGKRDHLNVFGNDYPTPDGTGVRDYIHVVDLAKGHVAAIQYLMTHTGEGVFNLGTGHGYSVLDMVHAFEEANGVKVPYEITARRPGDLATCYADPAKSLEVLGWKAEKNLVDMCRDTWNWQKQNPNGYEQ